MVLGAGNVLVATSSGATIVSRNRSNGDSFDIVCAMICANSRASSRWLFCFAWQTGGVSVYSPRQVLSKGPNSETKMHQMLTKAPSFRVSTSRVSFERPLDSAVYALNYLQSQDFFGDLGIRQLYRFFSEVGMTMFDNANRRTIVGHELYGKLYHECREGDTFWSCYTSASYMSLRCDEYHNFVLGFVDQHSVRNDDLTVINTFLHGFCANDNVEVPKFVDADNELACIDMRTQFERHKQTCTASECQRKRPTLLLEDFCSYCGVIIPRQIVDDIFNMPTKQGDGVGNLYGYLKRSVFNDHDRTTWFIDVVKNGGKGWEYTPLKYK